MTRSALIPARPLLALLLAALLAASSPAFAEPAPALVPPSAHPSAPSPAARVTPDPDDAPPLPTKRPVAGSAVSEPSLGASTTVALIALLGVGVMAWWRRRRLPAELSRAAIEVIAQAPLGGRARVLWLRTAGHAANSAARNMIVTVTPQAVQIIDRWPEPSLDEQAASTAATSSAPPQPLPRARRQSRVIVTSQPPASSRAAAAPDAATKPEDRARPRWDTATHRVIEDRARHLEATFSGESTFEGIPDDLAADLSADLPLLPPEPGAAKTTARSPAELLARAWRRTVARQPAETNNVRIPDSLSGAGAPATAAAGTAVRFSDNLAALRSPRPQRTARGSIGHHAPSVHPPAASPSARRPMVRTELRARRPAGARCRLPFRRHDEEDPQ